MMLSDKLYKYNFKKTGLSVRIHDAVGLILVFVLGIISIGCGGNRENQLLMARAELIMEDAPDSALILLDSVATEDLHSRYDKARYALLSTQAKVKNYIPVESDSLISSAVSYFKMQHSSSSSEFMKALFYQGQVRCDLGAYTSAILPIRQAYEISIRNNDEYWRAKCAELISEIYYNTFNAYEALKYNEEAAHYYKSAGKITNHYYSLTDKAVRLNYLHEYKRSEALLDSIERLALCMPVDSSLLITVNRAAMSCYDYKGDVEQVEHYAIKLREYGFVPSDKEDLYTHIKLAILKNDTVGISQRIRLLSNMSQSMSDSAGVVICRRMLAKKTGDFQLSEQLTDSLLKIYNRGFGVLVRNSALILERDFYGMMALDEQHKSELLAYGLISTVIIFLLLAIAGIVIYRYNMKVKNMAINEKIRDIQSITDHFKLISDGYREKLLEKENERVSELQSVKTEFNKKLAAMFSQKWSLLNALSSEYMDNSGSVENQKTVINRINAELEKLMNPKSLAEIETIVNEYNDDVMIRLRKQCVFLTETDCQLLLLTIAGLSSRAICMLIGIKLKNYYTRKYRLINKIKASDVPDKVLFINMLG